MNRLNHMLYEAFEDLRDSRFIYDYFSARAFERYMAEYFVICAIVDCIRKPYKKVG